MPRKRKPAQFGPDEDGYDPPGDLDDEDEGYPPVLAETETLEDETDGA